jgi:hypothetical protein
MRLKIAFAILLIVSLLPLPAQNSDILGRLDKSIDFENTSLTVDSPGRYK